MKIIAFTDGACSGNPGPGGWGVVLRAIQDHEIVKQTELFGGEADTTNNRMELMAAITALEVMSKPTQVTIITDSAYVKDGITKWIEGWKRKGWKTAANKPVKNAELWQRLEEAALRHQVEWQWIKGHAGHEGNELADKLARQGVEQVRRDASS